MPESLQHQRLVQIMYDFVSLKYFDGDPTPILIDSEAVPSIGHPPSIQGYRPDLFAIQPNTLVVILGEAKSIQDFENTHTLEQLSTFLTYCTQFPDSVLVIAVPWMIQRSAESLIRILKKRCNAESVNTLVLHQLPA